jgi:uncharacterized protein (TIGR02284 family)
MFHCTEEYQMADSETVPTETPLQLIEELVRVNRDSSKGFTEAADEVSEDAIAKLFRSLATERTALADELSKYLVSTGHEMESAGSMLAYVHRTWTNIRAKLNGGDPYVLLIEAERGEDHIKDAYDKALRETHVGSPMCDVLLRHYSCIKAGHDGIRDLRDAYKED